MDADQIVSWLKEHAIRADSQHYTRMMKLAANTIESLLKRIDELENDTWINAKEFPPEE